MFSDGSVAHGRRVLLLQGPIGPFFHRLAKYLEGRGATVFKVNLNGGDACFFPPWALPGRVFAFRGRPQAWRKYVGQLLRAQRIDAIVLFGDCRFYHRVAAHVARRLGVEVFVFEEGYIRPDYVTLERGGVNGFSQLPRDPEFYRQISGLISVDPPKPVGPFVIWTTILFAVLYGIAGKLLGWYFPRYRHHRRHFSVRQALLWLRSGVRKWVYRVQQRRVLPRLATELSQRYFLVTLQVHNDAQLVYHSRYRTIQQFIHEVVASFAAHADPDTYLVFKHHPMDRGFVNYRKLLERLAVKHGLGERLIYIHDLHLPTLLRHARGAVMINSTVGPSALFHRTPVKVMGTATFDMPGLTHQGSLDSFWRDPQPADRELFLSYRRYVIARTQLNGTFYSLRPFDWRQPGLAQLLGAVSSLERDILGEGKVLPLARRSEKQRSASPDLRLEKAE